MSFVNIRRTNGLKIEVKKCKIILKVIFKNKDENLKGTPLEIKWVIE